MVGILEFPENPNEDQRTAFVAGLLFTTVLVILGVVLFLTGRYLRGSSAVTGTPEAKQPGRPLRPLPLALYLGGTIAIALVAAFFPKGWEALRPLVFLVGQPFVFTQLLLGGMFGLKVESDVARQVVVTLAYFLALFYPLYRILTMDRTAEPACFKRMTTLLILLARVHVLIGLAFAMLIRA